MSPPSAHSPPPTLKNFNTGYLVGETVVLDRKAIAKNYLKNWFFLDLLSSIPFDYVPLDKDEGSESGARSLKVIKVFRVLRMAKLFRLARLTKVAKYVKYEIKRFQEKHRIQIGAGTISMSRLFCGLLLLVHWVGCLQFMLARIHNFPEESWVVRATLACPRGAFGEGDDDADPDVELVERCQDRGVWVQYSWAVFKAIAIMVNLGESVVGRRWRCVLANPRAPCLTPQASRIRP